MTWRTGVPALALIGCAAMLAGTSPAMASPRLDVQPTTVTAGHTITFSGSGFRASARVVVAIGPPRSEADPVGSTRTTSRGRFTLRLAIPATATPGRYVALGCQRSCRIKAQASFRIRAATTGRTASRRPTRATATAIRSAALRSLHGTGWQVSNIRVTTVRAAHRYASASVENARTGVGGEMILRRGDRRWRSIFLGTNDFCEARAPRAVLRDLGFPC